MEKLKEDGFRVDEFNGGHFGGGRFLNRRAEAYFRLRDRLHPDSPEPIAFPRDEELVEELLAIRWREQGGKVRIEEKSEIRARIGRSPDKADALSMLFQPGRKPAEAFEFRVY